MPHAAPLTLSACSVLLLAVAPAARAAVAPAVTVDGPSAAITEVGGVAMAEDGTGGLVYVRSVDGVPHVFLSRFAGQRWGSPLRVDTDRPYDGGSPRVAAGPGGRLLVVWVTQMATVHGRIQRGLVSAVMGAGAQSFGPSLVVDANVGDGTGVSPSLAGAGGATAVVAYRAITSDFTLATQRTTAVQLRPGDVLADIRVARLRGDRWSRLGAVNRNRAASMRAPDGANAPRIAATPDGSAVVAWQEPDETAAARIWARRVNGTQVGPVLRASPADQAGAPITDDVDAFALDVSPFGQAEIAMRLRGGPQSPLGAPRILLNGLPVAVDAKAGVFGGVQFVDAASGGPAPGGVGAPSVSVVDGGTAGATRVVFAAPAGPTLARVDRDGLTVGTLGPPAGDGVVTAITPAGGGVTAWPAADAQGRSGVRVQQDFPGGAAQTGFLSGVQAGAVDGLAIGRASSGDALLAFRQGEAGRFQIVGERVSVPPSTFEVRAPADWVRPARARVDWDPAPSGVGAVTYAVLVDGQVVARGLGRRSLTPSRARLGSGTRRVQVLAVDASGQSTLTEPVDLLVDARAPRVAVAADATRPKRLRPRSFVVTVADAASGVLLSRTTCSFGDGSRRQAAHRTFRHRYARPGRYPVTVTTRDRAGNATTIRLRVQAR